ncbi:MAG: right-handed parallel beta-helix repeat-containing protein, partial [Candidatus Bathyarchaeota archaeon]|nr:right-handed parallel beta-helix repeat-containing protein [Candidatus Bathyarchaeota archaeon]
MNKKTGLILILVLVLQVTISIQSISVVEANFLFPPLEQITIGNDGNISPSTVPIIQDGNLYTFTGNISDYVINVQLDNIIIDGAGYTIKKTRPAYGNQNGVSLNGRTNVTVRNLQIWGFVNGVSVSNSTECNVTENSFLDNGYGIVLVDHATSNYIFGNSLTSSGIRISNSTDNILRDNHMDGDGPHFSVTYENVESAADFVNDVDASNTINGKEICYWVNQHSRNVPSDSGYVVLVNCSEIEVENVNIADNGEGILLISTTMSEIKNNTLVGNNKGLVIYRSEENSFTSNTIVNSTYAILAYSPKNSFENNVLENNSYDINFEDRFIEEFDYSNLVDGAPICYWNWKNNMVVPENVGYVVLIGGSNITIQNLNITNRRQGILLVGVTDSVIKNNIILNTNEAIIMKGSSNNVVKSNLVENNTQALYLEACHSNNISGNKITYSKEVGVHMEDSNDNTVSGNYIAHCGQGLIINRGDDNVVTSNSLLYSKSKAVHLGESNNTTVTGNNIAWSKSWAISISGSGGYNIFHHNDFVNN